jgi:hypothetical protein
MEADYDGVQRMSQSDIAEPIRRGVKTAHVGARSGASLDSRSEMDARR